VYNKTVPDDDFIKSKHVVIKQVFLLVVLTDKIKSIFNISPSTIQNGRRSNCCSGCKTGTSQSGTIKFCIPIDLQMMINFKKRAFVKI
jgi:hypothetical protein